MDTSGRQTPAGAGLSPRALLTLETASPAAKIDLEPIVEISHGGGRLRRDAEHLFDDGRPNMDVVEPTSAA
jgi:hypothetical protein